jgi:HTH-type transcriptional regulator/antitoxin HigA
MRDGARPETRAGGETRRGLGAASAAGLGALALAACGGAPASPQASQTLKPATIRFTPANGPGSDVRQLEPLLARPALSAAERAYVDLLSDLLADWEDATVEIPDLHGAALVRALLEERGLRQKDLVGAGVFATESVASEVLARRRELTRRHIEALARYFEVSPAAFFPADRRPT